MFQVCISPLRFWTLGLLKPKDGQNEEVSSHLRACAHIHVFFFFLHACDLQKCACSPLLQRGHFRYRIRSLILERIQRFESKGKKRPWREHSTSRLDGGRLPSCLCVCVCVGVNRVLSCDSCRDCDLIFPSLSFYLLINCPARFSFALICLSLLFFLKTPSIAGREGLKHDSPLSGSGALLGFAPWFKLLQTCYHLESAQDTACK